MTAAEPFLRAALVALDEAGDPAAVRATLEAAVEHAAPLTRVHRPATARKQVMWAARQMAMAADQPARAYSRLRELLAALFVPCAGVKLPAAPAPEVAFEMAPAALIDALAPPPRVLARDLAAAARLDARALLGDRELARRVLGIRAIPQHSIAAYSTELAALIAGIANGSATASRVATVVDEPSAVGHAAADVEAAILRAEAIAVCSPAAEKPRAKLATALLPHLASTDAGVRASAIDGLHALRVRLDDAQLLVAMNDAVGAVRASATRTIATGPFDAANPRRVYLAEIEQRLIAMLDDVDPGVRSATLGAITRYPASHGPRLVEPLRAIVRRDPATSGDEVRTAVYLLGRLGAHATTAAIDIARALATANNPHQAGEALIAVLAGDTSVQIVDLLRACVVGPRSSAAYTASVVLDKLGVAVPEVTVEARIARAADELASDDRDAQWSALFEVRRLATIDSTRPAIASLIPAIQAIGDLVAIDTTPEARSTLATARDVLGLLGVPEDDLPRPPSRFEAYRGIAPRELEIHGAYAIASISGTVHAPAAVGVPVTSLGLWDNGTGKRLFVVERGELLAFVPGRAEAAVIRTEIKADAKRGGTSRADLAWSFERYTVPAGVRVASLAIPAALTYGWPLQLAIAADLATVWCGDEDEPYRFHVKLGDPDVLLDDTPRVGKRSGKRS